MSKFEKNIDAEYLKKSAVALQKVKEQSYEFLPKSDIHSILDVGCGPGIDVVAMAKLTDDNCTVVGLDFDESMLKEARRSAEENQIGSKVEFLQGSIAKLPFDNDTFDVVRAERLFQVVPESIATQDDIFKELYRVLKTGGCLILADTDWATASVNFSDIKLERKLIDFFSQECRPNGYSARNFYAQAREAKMNDIQQVIIPIEMYTFDENLPLADWLVKEASDKSVASTDELQWWMDENREKSEKNQFFCCVNMIVLKCVK